MDTISPDLRVSLGLAPSEEVEFRVADSVDAGETVRERLEYVGDDSAVIPAFLLKPKRQPMACGVVVYHQHNSEFHLGKSEVAGLVGDRRQALGSALAARGVTVLAPDAVSFEDRRRNAQGTQKRIQPGWVWRVTPSEERCRCTTRLWTSDVNSHV